MLKIANNTSAKKIVAYAEEELGVKLDENTERKELIAKVRELEAEQGITGDEGGKPKGEPKEKSGKTKPKFAVIRIHQPPPPDEESEPDTHCIVGFDGRNFQIQYDEEVKVPWGVYSVLKNAIQTKYFSKKGENGQMERHSKQVQRFPFSFIKAVD